MIIPLTTFDVDVEIHYASSVSRNKAQEEFREEAITIMALIIDQPIKTNSKWLKKRLIKVLNKLE